MRISDWSSDVCSSDLYIFFEGGLIPMYLIIGIWGGKDRIYASYKFFLYTFLGSVLMLVAMMWMVNFAGTPYIPTLLETDFPVDAQTRSEERRVGKECVSTGRSVWSLYH